MGDLMGDLMTVSVVRQHNHKTFEEAKLEASQRRFSTSATVMGNIKGAAWPNCAPEIVDITCSAEDLTLERVAKTKELEHHSGNHQEINVLITQVPSPSSHIRR